MPRRYKNAQMGHRGRAVDERGRGRCDDASSTRVEELTFLDARRGETKRFHFLSKLLGPDLPRRRRLAPRERRAWAGAGGSGAGAPGSFAEASRRPKISSRRSSVVVSPALGAGCGQAARPGPGPPAADLHVRTLPGIIEASLVVTRRRTMGKKRKQKKLADEGVLPKLKNPAAMIPGKEVHIPGTYEIDHEEAAIAAAAMAPNEDSEYEHFASHDSE